MLTFLIITKNIGNFFDKLKNSAADSVTYEDIAERLSDEDEHQIEEVLKNVVSYTDFDIANYTTMDEYQNALNVEPNGDRILSEFQRHIILVTRFITFVSLPTVHITTMHFCAEVIWLITVIRF